MSAACFSAFYCSPYYHTGANFGRGRVWQIMQNITVDEKFGKFSLARARYT